MYFLNLSLFQFLAIFGSISAVSVALYLLDRSRRRQVVSTLRFWVSAEHPSVVARRRRIQQPWSLVLQLISMALLLLAIAQLRFGAPEAAGRDHILLLETSAWMGARSGNRTLMDIARDRARQYLRALPARDRVMLVRADALATPVTAFEPDRRKLEAAIDTAAPGSAALNLQEVLGFARRLQQQGGRHAGEIAFIGAGRTAELDPTVELPRNLRFIAVPDAIENAGLRKIGMRRSNDDADLWEVYVSARNYGTRPRTVNIALDYGPPGDQGRVPAASRRVTLQPGADSEQTFELRTRAAVVLGVTLTPHDAFAADDHAMLEVPAQPLLPVTVYSEQPELLKPLLAATSRVVAVYKKPSEYVSNEKRAGRAGSLRSPAAASDRLALDRSARRRLADSRPHHGAAGALLALEYRGPHRGGPPHQGVQAGPGFGIRDRSGRHTDWRGGGRPGDCGAAGQAAHRGLRIPSRSFRHAL